MSEEKDLTALAEYESDPEEDTLLRGTEKGSKYERRCLYLTV
jgi:hypothetical protein